MLPRVKIYFENGALGQVIPSPDGVLGVMCTGNTVSGLFSLDTPYVVKKMADITDNLGISEANNPSIYKFFNDFYKVAPEGTEVWLMAFSETVLMDDMINDQGQNFLRAANGRLRGLIVMKTPNPTFIPNIMNGLEDDVWDTITSAQTLGQWSAETLYAPIFTIVEGRGYRGNPVDLTDLLTMSNDRVGVFLGNDHGTTDVNSNESMGLLAGRIASTPVHRHIGRVKDGPLPLTNAYILDFPIEKYDVESLHDKGFIALRNFVGKTGYYFTDDHLACNVSNDYHYLTARRTIDKAYRIAYNTLLEELLDTIPVNEDGSMQAPMAKMWESKIENAIALQMTANGELSADVTDPKDRGVQAFIDPTMNVVSTGKVVARIRVKPFGYARFIDIYIGFKAIKV